MRPTQKMITATLSLAGAFALAGCVEKVPPTKAICQQTGPTSFKVVETGDNGRTLYTLDGKALKERPYIIRGQATVIEDESKVSLEANFGNNLCITNFDTLAPAEAYQIKRLENAP